MKRLLALLTAAMLIGAFVAPSTVSANSSTKGCQGYMQAISTIQLPAGYWGLGQHTYRTHFVDANPDPYWAWDWTSGPQTFTVDANAPLYKGNVLLVTWDFGGGYGWGSLWSVDGPILDNRINPAQQTVFWGGWMLPVTTDTWNALGYLGTPYTMQQWKAEMAMSPVSFIWGGEEVVGNQGPIQSVCVGTGGGSQFLRTYGNKF